MLNNDWKTTIGLEVHAQIKSSSKLFSAATTDFGREPNSSVALFDIAVPGTLPVLNKHCVIQAVKTALALNCNVSNISIFDRKNYFYPDLASGYQISQFFSPIAKNGYLDIAMDDAGEKRVQISSMHMEQDAGKNVHDLLPDKSCIDFNRAGIGLMEIITSPCIGSAQEAAEYIKSLRNILRYIDTCDGDMEKGSLRCDANVSVSKDQTKLGTRCEIKNLNSISSIIRAIEYEVGRQIEVLESGGAIMQATRLFDEATGRTRQMRSKEEASDYRYFPDPDLLPLYVSDEYIASIKDNMPELPQYKEKRYIKQYNLNAYDASVLTAEKEHAAYFEKAVEGSESNAKQIANWIITEVFGYLNKNNISILKFDISPESLSALVNLIEDGSISGKIAKVVFKDMIETGKPADIIVKEKNLLQISDPKEIQILIDNVLDKHKDIVSEYKSGKTKSFGFLVGQVLKASGGKANPGLVNQLLGKSLN